MGFWDDEYDFANGAPFGDFDMDDDGELDIVEKSQKLDYYSDLWKDEDKVSNIYEDDDIYASSSEISPIGSFETSDLDLLLGIYEKDELDDLADEYGVSTEYLKERGIELGYFEEDEDEDSDWLYKDDQDGDNDWLNEDDQDENSNWLYEDDQDENSNWLYEDEQDEDSNWLNEDDQDEDNNWLYEDDQDEDNNWLYEDDQDEDNNWLNEDDQDEDNNWLYEDDQDENNNWLNEDDQDEDNNWLYEDDQDENSNWLYEDDQDEDSNWLYEDDQDENNNWLYEDDQDEDNNWLYEDDQAEIDNFIDDGDTMERLAFDIRFNKFLGYDDIAEKYNLTAQELLDVAKENNWICDEDLVGNIITEDGIESIENEFEEIYQEDIEYLAQKYNVSKNDVVYKALQYGFYLEIFEPEENELKEHADYEYRDDAYFESEQNKEDIMDTIENIFLFGSEYIEKNEDDIGVHILEDLDDEEKIHEIYYKLEDKTDKIFNLAYNYLRSVMYDFERHPAIHNVAALIVFGVVFATCNEKIRAYFIMKNWNKTIAARYLLPDDGFNYDRVVNENLQLGEFIKTPSILKESCISDMIPNIAKKDFDKAMDVWLWILEIFFPYREYAFHDSKFDFISQVLYELELKYNDSMKKYFKKASKLKETLYLLGNDDIYLDAIRNCESKELSVGGTSKWDDLAKTPKYMYCGVIFTPTSKKVYHYRSRNESIKVGDIVKVWTENRKQMTEVIVVSVGYYSEIAVPYPLDKAKFIEE